MAASWESGVGVVVSGAAVVHGMDTFQAGVRQLRNGAPTRTVTAWSLGYVTGSPYAGELLDVGVGTGLTLGGAWFAQGPRTLVSGVQVAPETALRRISLPIVNPQFTPNATLPQLVVRQAESRGLATPRDALVLWSGLGDDGVVVAQAWARANGGMTLEMTPGGRWLDRLDLFGAGGKSLGITRLEAAEIWEQVSANAVGQGSGQVRVLLGNRYGAGRGLWSSVYWRVEMPAMVTNPSITGIDEIQLLPKYIGVKP